MFENFDLPRSLRLQLEGAAKRRLFHYRLLVVVPALLSATMTALVLVLQRLPLGLPLIK